MRRFCPNLKKFYFLYKNAELFLGGLRRVMDLRRKHARLSDIKILSIEFSSVCNLNCCYCFLNRDNNRPLYLDTAIYEKLIREICENPEYHIQVMEWPISGEFFMNKHWREFVEITRTYMDAFPLFRPMIVLNDNMMMFDPAKINHILEQNVISQIICSLDGWDKESLERMRPGAEFETILSNTTYLVEANQRSGRPLELVINNGCDRDKEVPLCKEYEELFARVNRVRRWKPSVLNQSFHLGKKKFHRKSGFCSFVHNSVAISTSGSIIKCCMDLQEATAYGNLEKQTLSQIWNSKARLDFMNKMLKFQRRKIPGCDSCSVGWTNNYSDYLIHKH